jgi:hypothetical protein
VDLEGPDAGREILIPSEETERGVEPFLDQEEQLVHDDVREADAVEGDRE